MYKKIIVILISFFVVKASAQNYNYISIPDSLRMKVKLDKENYHIDSALDLTIYLPSNYVKDASEDYTEYIQKGINEHSNIIFPNFPILINDNGLDFKDNTIVYFQDNSELILKPSNKRSYQMIRVHNKKNITIYSPTLRGDRKKHFGDAGGEWGMGISIRGSENINIIDFDISDCWGDGIYVGHSKTFSKNISINGGVIDNNRRNGISIVSVDKLLVQNVLLANSNGTNPQTGLDIEPNNIDDEINNIVLKNLVTFNNYKNGILVHLDKLPSKVQKRTNIEIDTFRDILSGRAVRVSGAYNGDKKNKPLKGKVLFRNITLDESKNESVFNKNKFFPPISIESVK